jgi:hypothetical protein
MTPGETLLLGLWGEKATPHGWDTWQSKATHLRVRL